MEKSSLKKDNLNIIETIALSVAVIAPTAAMALNISLMAETASFSTPLVFLFATIIVGLVAYSIIEFNKHISSSGSLYTFTKVSLGKKMGFTSGWALLLAYITLASGTLAAFGNFFGSFLAQFGLNVHWVIISLVFTIPIFILGIADAKICNRIMLALEGLSIFLILILTVVILFKVGTIKGFTPMPFNTNGVSMSAIASTSVFAFLSFIGFESASSLGEETKNPKKSIPIAIISAVFATGLLFLVCSYAQVIGFGLDASGLKALTSTSSPLTILADKYMSKSYGTILILSASLSFFSCALGSACAGARMLFTMSREGLMPKKFGKVHPKYNTPYFALIVVTVLIAVIIAPLSQKDGIDIFGYYGTIGSIAILVSYLFTSVGAIVYFTKKKIWGIGHTIIPGLSIIALFYVLYCSVYPIPKFPKNIFPCIVLGWIAIGFVISNIVDKGIRRDAVVMTSTLVTSDNQYLKELSQED